MLNLLVANRRRFWHILQQSLQLSCCFRCNRQVHLKWQDHKLQS